MHKEIHKEITVSRIIHAPVARVWQAWTDEKQVRQWWSPKGFTTPVCEVDARVGGAINIVMLGGEGMGQFSGMKAPMQGVFTEVIENKKLAFKNVALDEQGHHLLEGMTTVMFSDEDGQTKVTVETGASGEGEMVPAMLAGMEQGWNEQMDKLVEFLK
jgi:uncharacterized protein YndB with AHSA1/START domain